MDEEEMSKQFRAIMGSPLDDQGIQRLSNEIRNCVREINHLVAQAKTAGIIVMLSVEQDYERSKKSGAQYQSSKKVHVTLIKEF